MTTTPIFPSTNRARNVFNSGVARVQNELNNLVSNMNAEFDILDQEIATWRTYLHNMGLFIVNNANMPGAEAAAEDLATVEAAVDQAEAESQAARATGNPRESRNALQRLIDRVGHAPAATPQPNARPTTPVADVTTPAPAAPAAPDVTTPPPPAQPTTQTGYNDWDTWRGTTDGRLDNLEAHRNRTNENFTRIGGQIGGQMGPDGLLVFQNNNAPANNAGANVQQNVQRRNNNVVALVVFIIMVLFGLVLQHYGHWGVVSLAMFLWVMFSALIAGIVAYISNH